MATRTSAQRKAKPARAATRVWVDYDKTFTDPEYNVVGNVKVLQGLYSPQLCNRRDVLVYLPPSYEESDTRYPVVYMHDGQNLFDPATAFAGEWGVDETLEATGNTGVEAIVIGVPNMGPDRLNEYSPFEDLKLGGGQGDGYLDFIVETLKPIVDRDFRTLVDRENTGIVGSSMGGLISLYAFFARSETFGFTGVMSPALWFADRAILNYVEEAPFNAGRIYLDVGTREGSAELADVRHLRDLLVRKGYRIGEDFLYVVEMGGRHSEAAWGRRLRGELRFLLRE